MGAWDVMKMTLTSLMERGLSSTNNFLMVLWKKFKACFCAHGDQQLEGIDFFETYALVVQWTTVRLMLILENLLGLKSKQADVTTAFLHATPGEDEKVYVKMPLGFKQCGSNGKYKSFVLRKLSMACAKVLAPFGNISLRSVVTVIYRKLLLIPVFLLVKRSLQSVMLMI